MNAPLNDAGQDELDAFVLAFERAYARDPDASAADFLPGPGHALYRAVLVELVRVDLEFARDRGLPRTAEDYRRLFPALESDPEALREIAFEESRLRRLADEADAASPSNRRRGRLDAATAVDDRPPSGLSVSTPAPPPPRWAVDDDSVFADLRRSDPVAASRVARALDAMPVVGTRLLGFALVKELGRGAFGRVFLARQGDLADRPVVLKVCAEVYDESQSMAQLQHTNIVPVYSVHHAPPFQVICMPYLGAATLADLLADVRESGTLPGSGTTLIETLSSRRNGKKPGKDKDARPAPAPESTARGEPARAAAGSAGTLAMLGGMTYVEAVLWVAAHAASGLAHAHGRGILHRDLKPANILLADDGQPLLLDFNLAADTKRDGRGAVAAIGGTLPYMAPEHLDAFRDDSRPVDARGDIYALGVILFELLTGRLPFETPRGASLSTLPRMIEDRHGPVPRARAWNAHVTPAVDSIVGHCLEPDPDRRYATADALREDLERQLAHRPLRYAPEPSLRERASKFVRRHPALCGTTSLALMSILLIAFVAGLGWRASVQSGADRARVKADEFRAAFDRCQLLLNADGPSVRLRDGLTQARRALDGYGVLGPKDWLAGPLVRDLPEPRRKALRSEASELVSLAARARVSLLAGGRAEALETAVIWLDAAERSDPRPTAALYEQRARYLDALGRADRARADRARAATVAPVTARDFALLGQALLSWKRYDAAEPMLGRAVALDPRRFWAWFLLGICHADQGRFTDAAADFAVSATIAPEFAWPHHNRGLALARAGRLVEARISYDRALALDPDFGEALVNRALASLQLGDHVSAAVDLDRAATLGLPSTLAQAEALARLGRRDWAEKAFASAVAASPGDPSPLAVRGVCRISYDREGALADFRRALALDPRCARARVGLAYLWRRDDPRAAMAEAQRALDADPELADALELRALLRARLGIVAAESDADRLLRTPTPGHLYNAACALALLSRSGASDASDAARLRARALDLLGRAVEAGHPRSGLAHDPDLDALRASPRFAGLSRAGGG